jgi:hypothetical protein
MEHDHKRQLRQLKREIKRAGNKRLRRQLKREVVENPEDAPFTEVSFGRWSSAGLNGLDRKANQD